MRATLALEDGAVYEGTAFGATGDATGEVVFNTSMTGYQEILTDPSYVGQICVMTYPLIGNYGIVPEDFESDEVQVEGFVVREYTEAYSNWRATESLGDFLKRHGVLGIEGVDTRAITRRVRQGGELRAVISTENHDHAQLVERAKALPGLEGTDLARQVTTDAQYAWKNDVASPTAWMETDGAAAAGQLTLDFGASGEPRVRTPRHSVVALDFGMKRNIARELSYHGCEVTVVPAATSAEDILALDPDGVFLSNGPGDPDPVSYAIDNIRKLVGRKPVFGICLGHQLLGLALGLKRYKMKFGHRGANQPVMRLDTGRVEITSQNHSFCIDPESLDSAGVEVTHNDEVLRYLDSRYVGPPEAVWRLLKFPMKGRSHAVERLPLHLE
ncbi:carbamoyl phosphate synthase small subunit, partial [Candidatus Poribacteria bacterium]|nr:carbamoyl phosphate synthase small subunit [Candidatus Poribacteria bacterium]